MRLFSLHTLLFLSGISLIVFGYNLLAISPDASAEEMLSRAKSGMLSVVSGGTLLMLWMARR